MTHAVTYAMIHAMMCACICSKLCYACILHADLGQGEALGSLRMVTSWHLFHADSLAFDNNTNTHTLILYRSFLLTLLGG